MRSRDRTVKLVEWSEEDGCCVGCCPGLMAGGVHGGDESEVYRELIRAVEEWIAIHEAGGEPLPAATAGRSCSGRFVLRVSPELHRQLHLRALRAEDSLNGDCVQVLEGATR